MHHFAEKLFATGTWFSTLFWFLTEYLNADFVFKSIMAMLSFTLLILQITNQLHIWLERRRNKKTEK